MSDFTRDGFGELITLVRGCGHVFLRFSDRCLGNHRKVCFLRHDVDNSPEAALELGELERSLDVVSTYFFMVTSEVYNIFSPEVRKIVAALADLGHEIGLHFSEAAYQELGGNAENWNTTLCARVEEEASLIERLILPVNAVSFHQPSERLRDRKPELGKRINAYRPQDLGGAHYLSDSNTERGGEYFSQVFSLGRHGRIQLLLHPMWWRRDPADLRERWCQVLDDRVSTIWKHWQSCERTVGAEWSVPGISRNEFDGGLQRIPCMQPKE